MSPGSLPAEVYLRLPAPTNVPSLEHARRDALSEAPLQALASLFSPPSLLVCEDAPVPVPPRKQFQSPADLARIGPLHRWTPPPRARRPSRLLLLVPR